MKEQVALQKVYGDVFFTARTIEGNAFIYAQWFGVQSVETVKEGGYKLLDMIKEQPCSKLLNSNKHVIGSWDMALDWAENEWAPQMKAAGLKYLAQVVPSSIYATLCIESLIQQIDSEFEIRMFEEDADAEAWLLSLDK
ncbi:hypothetical protein DXT99_21900 [Pontibacter diazotrophicus]|uniref:STAS/SEC14 domain-containing protein n=1 Tax=Pontibacter diazotrophicus TaxID=1400979 RepID=A0A3D8L7S4_9BACT|nr:hypothetical protein [Pontibacter diazotrophicus]RDV13032.1 hypothetical protein DXT99_21900 [Pontibacter diazotrophicus]